MATESAEALLLAKPPFDDVHNVPLRLIVSFGSHVLVCRPDFKARDAYLVAQTLAKHNDALPTPARAPSGVVPAHRGSLAFFGGEEMPSDEAGRRSTNQLARPAGQTRRSGGHRRRDSRPTSPDECLEVLNPQPDGVGHAQMWCRFGTKGRRFESCLPDTLTGSESHECPPRRSGPLVFLPERVTQG